MNYAELQTAIADYMHRSDLTSMIPTFIQLAESSLFRELKPKDLEVSVTGLTTGATIDLPADFNVVSRLTITYAGAERTLDYKSQANDATSGSVPQYFSLEKDAIRLFPAPSGEFSYTLYYIQTIPNLSGTQTTNWLLENASDLYLYASCLEASKYIRSAEQVAALTQMIPTMIEAIRRSSERRGQPNTGSLQVKPRR